jgi:hypothetical protein
MTNSVWNENVTKGIIDSVKLWELRARGERPQESCPLCLAMRNDDKGCVNCPLSLRGFNCHKENSLWERWCATNSIHIAEQMVITLKSLFYPEKEKKKEIFYERGQRFKERYNGEKEFILCRSGAHNLIQLTSLTDGNYWTYSVEVKDDKKITEEEFKKISNSGVFTLIEDKKEK